jgi:NADH-quinone oxidoreductase subunit M
MAIISVVGIVYGAFVAFAQDDVKKLVAYSSVSHLGFCMLGLVAFNAMAIEGSIFAMLSHGLTTSGLFLAIGVLYERRHTRRLADFGGLWAQMPVFAALFLLCVLGSAGLPGLSGFVGEYLTIFGTFVADKGFPEGWPAFLPAPKLLAGVAATGVIFGAIYLLFMFQKVMFGPITKDENRGLPDVTWREIAVFLPLIALIFGMGLFPRPFLRAMEPAVNGFFADFKAKLAEPHDVAHVIGQPPPGGEPPGDEAAPPSAEAPSAEAPPATPPPEGGEAAPAVPAPPTGGAP